MREYEQIITMWTIRIVMSVACFIALWLTIETPIFWLLKRLNIWAAFIEWLFAEAKAGRPKRWKFLRDKKE